MAGKGSQPMDEDGRPGRSPDRSGDPPPAGRAPGGQVSAGGAALAALTVCESLLICLVERRVFDASELEEVLQSARAANLHAEAGSHSRSDRLEAAAVIRQLLVRCQSARPDKRIGKTK